jgi:hypothetical protein
MRENEEGLTPVDWLPMYFDEDNQPTQEDIDEMKKELAAMGLIC